MWSENSERWSESFEKLENSYLNAFAVGFKHMQTTNISFEAMRDNFRYFCKLPIDKNLNLANTSQLQHCLKLYVKD